MPKNKVSDPITDQEIAFARLILSGAMTDRHAAEAVGLNPDSAAYTKAKPRVRAYMLEHRAAVQQQLVQQEAEGMHRRNLDREKVLDRLWEIANLSPDMTRGSITGQVKALSMIVAMQNFIPDRRAISSAAWRAPQQATNIDPQPAPAPDQQENEPASPARPACPGLPWSVPWESKLAPGSAGEASPDPIELSSRLSRLSRLAVELAVERAVGPERPVPASRGSVVVGPAVSPGPSQSKRFTPSEAPPTVPLFTSIPDLGVPFCTKKEPFNPFIRPR